MISIIKNIFLLSLLSLVQGHGFSKKPPPFCSVCECRMDNTEFYKVNCTTDIKSRLFINNYWLDDYGEEYSYRTLIVENTAMERLDLQFPKSTITSLFLRHCSITYISDSTFGNFVYLQKLVLSHNNLESFHPKAFAGYYREKTGHGLLPLTQLLLDHNNIKTLSREIFKYNRDIEILSLAHNPLELNYQTIKAINGLSTLKKLDLSHTQLSSLPLSFLTTTKELRFLDLSGNQFATVPENLPNVQSLKFGGNPVKMLRFPVMTALKTLNVCNTPELEEIEEGSLAQLKNLEELHLCDNTNLKSIHKDAFLRTTSHYRFWAPVERLFLQNNSLSSLDMGLLEWDHLQDFDFSNNPWSCDCVNRWIFQDLYPHILLKVDKEKAQLLQCGTPDSLHFDDVYKNNKMATCWTFHFRILNWVYDFGHSWSLKQSFFSLSLLIGTLGVFWYIRRNT